MQMTPRPESSTIAAIGYDRDNHLLAVQFKSGGTYHYLGVPPGAHTALVAAESVGKHFHAHIKGKYETVKQESAP